MPKQVYRAVASSMTTRDSNMYTSEILMASNNGRDLAASHAKIVMAAEKDQILSISEMYDLKEIHEMLFMGFYNKSDFE